MRYWIIYESAESVSVAEFIEEQFHDYRNALDEKPVWDGAFTFDTYGSSAGLMALTAIRARLESGK